MLKIASPDNIGIAKTEGFINKEGVRIKECFSLSIRWLLEATRKKPNSEYKTFSEKLAAEIISAINNEGEAIRKRDSVHKMADANKAFAHFRF